jgi:hypothetical protein
MKLAQPHFFGRMVFAETSGLPDGVDHKGAASRRFFNVIRALNHAHLQASPVIS